MKLWILRFIPYEGGTPIDGVFRTKEAADRAHTLAGGFAPFVDDFGVWVALDARRCAVVLTDTEVSAAINAALQTANHDAAKSYGIPSGLSKGSTVQ